MPTTQPQIDRMVTSEITPLATQQFPDLVRLNRIIPGITDDDDMKTASAYFAKHLRIPKAVATALAEFRASGKVKVLDLGVLLT